MKTKIILISIFIFMIIGVIVLIVANYYNENAIEEYQPEEEFSVNQERKTMVSLYFKNKATGKIEPEIRLVDVKELMNKPYETILTLLLEGPRKDTLEKTIPDGTKINEINLKGETLWIDLSKEFIENHPGGKEKEKQTIDSLVKTFTDLTEINSIKIIINGNEEAQFLDEEISFNTPFIYEE